jgi:hypothetical protein
MSHTITVSGIGFTFDLAAEVLSIDALTEKLDADSLQEAAREMEASEEGIVFPQIINTSGKVTLDAESETGLNVVLQETWLILSLKASGLFTVSGGNVVSDVSGVEIFAPNPTVDTQNNTSQAGVRVFTNGGGGCDLTELYRRLDILNDNVHLASMIIPATQDLAPTLGNFPYTLDIELEE